MASRSVGRAASAGLALALLVVGTSCSWSRFSDIQKNTPNVLLKMPKVMTAGFGDGVAAATALVTDSTTHKQSLQVRLLATGSPGQWGGAVYNLGTSDQPDLDAVDTGHCSEGVCKLARIPVGMPFAGSKQGPLPLCFISGLMQQNLAKDYYAGPTARCKDGWDYSFEAPPDVKTNVIDPAFNSKLGLDPPDLVLGVDHTDHPVLIAGVRQQYGNTVRRRAWFYPPDVFRVKDDQLLTPPGSSMDAGYASAVAALSLSDGTRILAVGAPGPQGHVWLFRLDKGKSKAYPVGCLGGPPGFGRTLASGEVDADQDDDLVVADDQNVSVFSGKALGELKQTQSTQCSLASLPPGGLIASFGCGLTPSISGCSTSDFGASLAVANLDGNPGGAVVVGAPGMTVRGTSDAGALLIYAVSPEQPDVLSDVDFISSAQDGDRLGTSVTTVRVSASRDIIAAGAPGHQKVAVFYCSKLLPASERGARCK